MIPAGPQPCAPDQSGCPADLNYKGSPKIYPIECRKEFQKIYEIKCECQMECQKIRQKNCRLVVQYLLEESNLFRRLSKIDLRQPKWRLVGPCAHHRHQQQRKRHQSSIWTWMFFWWCILHQYSTYLQPDDATHRSLYTEQLLRAGILTQRGLCTEETFVHRHLYTQRLLHKEGSFYIPMRCAKMLLRT